MLLFWRDALGRALPFLSHITQLCCQLRLALPRQCGKLLGACMLPFVLLRFLSLCMPSFQSRCPTVRRLLSRLSLWPASLSARRVAAQSERGRMSTSLATYEAAMDQRKKWWGMLCQCCNPRGCFVQHWSVWLQKG